MLPTRRSFIAAAPAVWAAPKTPSDRIRLGLIGSGGRGSYLTDEVQKADANAAITHVCDVWKVNRESGAARAAKYFNVDVKQTTRFQELLADKDVDAVLIATPDFTHPMILKAAVEAGKDAYCEKPMGVSLVDAREAYLAVKKSKQVVQVGTQRRSDPGLMGVARFLQGGSLGKLTRINMEVHFQEPRWRRPPTDVVRPEDVDWQAFQFGRIQEGFNPKLLREWQLHKETTNGIPGLWMSHFIDLVPWYTGDPYPKSVVSAGGVFLWKDGRDTTDVFHTLLEYPQGFLVSFAMSLTNETGSRNLWCGTKGTLDADALKASGRGSRLPDRIREEIAIGPETDVESHMANFLNCVRSRQTPRADIQAGFSHAVAGCLSAEALRLGRRVTFDAAALAMV